MLITAASGFCQGFSTFLRLQAGAPGCCPALVTAEALLLLVVGRGAEDSAAAAAVVAVVVVGGCCCGLGAGLTGALLLVPIIPGGKGAPQTEGGAVGFEVLLPPFALGVLFTTEPPALLLVVVLMLLLATAEEAAAAEEACFRTAA